MRRLFCRIAILLLVGAISWNTQGEEIRIAVGMKHSDVVEMIQKAGGADITAGLAVVGPKGEWPLKGLYWELKKYDAIVRIAEQGGKIAAMSYWTTKDFGHSKEHRAKSEQRIHALRLDTKRLTVSMEKPLSTKIEGENGDEVFLKMTYQSRRQDFEWEFSRARILKTPEWNVERDPAPLDPGKAWKIAREWMRKHGCEEPDLIAIQLLPFLSEEQARRAKSGAELTKRFYYAIHCIPAYFDSMVVYVLMDGTVLEPVKEPHKDLW